MQLTLLIHDCAAAHSLNHIVKFTDETIVLGLIGTYETSPCRKVVEWSQKLLDFRLSKLLSILLIQTHSQYWDGKYIHMRSLPVGRWWYAIGGVHFSLSAVR